MGNMLVKMGTGLPVGSPKKSSPFRPWTSATHVVLLPGGQSTAGNSNFGETMNVMKMRGLPVVGMH